MIPASPMLSAAPLVLGPAEALPNLLVALLVLALLILVARFVLNLAWRLVKLAALLVAVLWVLSLLLNVRIPLLF
jgi:hypothetical protein